MKLSSLSARRLGLLLMLTGAVLLLAAAFYWVQERDETPAQESSNASESSASSSATPRPSLAIRLGPTAQAAAALLPAPTPIATPAAPGDWPGAAARVVIPAIGVDAPVTEVGWRLERSGQLVRGVWDTVAGAAGHHRGSADPGQPGNCVLSAHSSDAGGAVFRGLERLVSGDALQLYTVGGQRFTYVVNMTLTLDEIGASTDEKREHAKWLDPTVTPVLTLVTCWPDWAYTHRIVVRADLRAP